MDPVDKDCLKQIDNLLGSNQQSWLFGAGISKGANIPLMDALTHRIFSIADRDDKKAKKTLDAIKAQLPERAHIEHIRMKREHGSLYHFPLYAILGSVKK